MRGVKAGEVSLQGRGGVTKEGIDGGPRRQGRVDGQQGGVPGCPTAAPAVPAAAAAG